MSRFLLVGSGPASINCALTLKRLNPDAKIRIITEATFLFSKMAGPSILKEEIEPSNLIKLPPSGVEIEFNQKVIGVDVEKKVIFSKNKDWKYDKLFIGTGSRHRAYAFHGAFYPDEYSSMLELRNLILGGQVKRAVIYGFGMVTLELLDILYSYGIVTYIVSSSSYPLSNLLFFELGSKLASYFSQFTKIIFDNRINFFDGKFVYLEDGTPIPCDALIVTKGTVANPLLPELEVNDFMQTRFEDVFSGGDAVKVRDIVTDEFKFIHLNSVAWKMGYYAGLNMSGVKAVFPGAIFLSVTKTRKFTVFLCGDLKKFDDFEIQEGHNSLLCRTFRDGKETGLLALNQEVDFSNFSCFMAYKK